MEKNNKTKTTKTKQTPVFLVLYIIFAAVESSIWRERTAFFEQMLIIVAGHLILTAAIYLIKNNIARFIVFLLITVLPALYNYQYAFCFVPVGALLCIYKALITEEKENDILIKLYSGIFGVVVIWGTVDVIQETRDFKLNEDLLDAVFMGFILVAIFVLALKNMKKERGNFKKSLKKPYTTVFVMSVIGVVYSVIVYDVLLHNRITFFPWYLFLCVLVYEKDVCMVNFGKSLIQKADNMLKNNTN